MQFNQFVSTSLILSVYATIKTCRLQPIAENIATPCFRHQHFANDLIAVHTETYSLTVNFEEGPTFKFEEDDYIAKHL